jgi:hypothetical protein
MSEKKVMSERKFGRIKGQTKSQSVISDILLYPYDIQIDDYSFTVINSTKPSNGFEGSFTTLSGAINKIIQYNIASKKQNYSLQEFIDEYNKIKIKIQNLLPL